jgi:formylglycine-generating enzyme required for sulfatase activity
VFADFELNGVRFDWRWIPPGRFWMGSPHQKSWVPKDELPRHEVILTRGFWMGRTPVTQAQWGVVLEPNPAEFKGGNRPVETLTWNEARAFAEHLNRAVKGLSVTLPTEAQWEYACRAGEAGPYSGGTIEQVAWYDGNSAGQTHDVGTKQANAWGLHDMHGNVREWCADWLDDTLPVGTDPTGASSGSFRVYRGGSWSFRAGSCRAADRLGNTPGYRDYGLGFRLCLSSETIR